MKAEYERKLDKKVSRTTAKVRKEYERKYGDLENVLRAGTGKETVEELTQAFTDFYKKNGMEIPSKPQYTERDTEILARHEADEIIKYGLEEVIEEVDRLADLGVDNMTQKEKAMFKHLAEYRKATEEGNALEKLGVSKEVYTSNEFKDFAKKFSATTPITEIYEIYNSQKPKKELGQMGSMTSTVQKDKGIKDFYTVEEAKKFTKKDFDNNPKLFEAVQKSMYAWKK